MTPTLVKAGAPIRAADHNSLVEQWRALSGGGRGKRPGGRVPATLLPGNPVWAINKTGTDLRMGDCAAIKDTPYTAHPLQMISDGSVITLRAPLEDDYGNVVIAADKIANNAGGWVYECGVVLARLEKQLNPKKIWDYADIETGQRVLTMRPDGTVKILWKGTAETKDGELWILARLKTHHFSTFDNPYEDIDTEWELHDPPNGYDGRKLTLAVVDPAHYGDLPEGILALEATWDGSGHLVLTGGMPAGTPSNTPSPTPSSTPTSTPTASATPTESNWPSESPEGECASCAYDFVMVNVNINDPSCADGTVNGTHICTYESTSDNECTYSKYWDGGNGDTYSLKVVVRVTDLGGVLAGYVRSVRVVNTTGTTCQIERWISYDDSYRANFWLIAPSPSGWYSGTTGDPIACGETGTRYAHTYGSFSILGWGG